MIRTFQIVTPVLNGLPGQAVGPPDRGQIVRLFTGQCHGTIRTANGREIWFHRSDMSDRAAFNNFVVGDSVIFDLLEDRISGARALRVRPTQSAM